jgi:hypothetical protein
MRALAGGVNVAVIFDRGQELPETWQGAPVIDGDLDDYRWLDPRGVVVALREKIVTGRKGVRDV